MVDVKLKQRKDYEFAINSVKTLFNDLRIKFGDTINGINVVGSVPDKYFILPVSVKGISKQSINELCEASIPILGESRGSDIDVNLFITEECIIDVAKYLSKKINNLGKQLRIEHITLLPYKKSVSNIKKIISVVKKGKKPGEMQFMIRNCYFITSDFEFKRLVKKFGASTIPQKNTDIKRVCRYRRRWTFLIGPYKGYNYGFSKELKELLKVDKKIKKFLLKVDIDEKIKDEVYDDYLKKKKRFKMLKKILKK